MSKNNEDVTAAIKRAVVAQAQMVEKLATAISQYEEPLTEEDVRNIKTLSETTNALVSIACRLEEEFA